MGQEARLAGRDVEAPFLRDPTQHGRQHRLCHRYEVAQGLMAVLADLEVDGEMQGDTALDERVRREVVGDATFSGEANLLVMPNIDAANIAYNLLKTAAGNNIAIGPLLLGVGAPVNVLTAQATVRRIVNVTALTVIEANAAR